MIIKRPMVVLQYKNDMENYWITERTFFNHSQEILDETANSTGGVNHFNFIKEFITEVQI